MVAHADSDEELEGGPGSSSSSSSKRRQTSSSWKQDSDMEEDLSWARGQTQIPLEVEGPWGKEYNEVKRALVGLFTLI